jgi:adenylate cyclase class 2
MLQVEIEVKFCQVNHDDIRQKLKNIGTECVLPMRTMRRSVLEQPFMREDKDSFIRVRDEGDKITMTYKQFDSLSLHGAKEIEVEVSDYAKTIAIFEQAGLRKTTEQESKRETWCLDEVEIVLDEWPWIKPYIEIEGKTEAEVRKVAQKLGFSWDDAVFGDVMAVYRLEYPHLKISDTIGTVSHVRFGDPLPPLLHKP